MTRPQTQIDELANSYSQGILDRSPESVTSLGLSGADESTFSDYSPVGLAEVADLQRSTLQTLNSLEPVDDVDRVTIAAMRERLGLELENYDAYEFGEINNIASPLQGITEVFDLMPTETQADWELVAQRLRNIPQALRGWQETLTLRVAHGPAHAKRQINLAITEAHEVAGENSALKTLAQRGAQAFPHLAEKTLRSSHSSTASLRRTI